MKPSLNRVLALTFATAAVFAGYQHAKAFSGYENSEKDATAPSREGRHSDLSKILVAP